MAAFNHVDRQVALVVKSGRFEEVPDGTRARLDRLARAAVLQDQELAHALAQVVGRLQASGIEVMVLKGLSIAERLYPEPRERTAGDIDVLVQQASLDRASAELEALGYLPLQPDWYRRQHFHVPFRMPGSFTCPTVELHWHVVKPSSSLRFDVGRWWKEAVSHTLRCGGVLAPPLEEEVTYLCHHAFLRGAVTLRSLQDVARWVVRYGDEVDWRTCLERAREGGTSGFLIEGLRLCADLWGVDLGAARPLVDTQPPRRWLARNLLHRSTIVQVGSRTWWPFGLVCHWSLLDPSKSGPGELMRRATGNQPRAGAVYDPSGKITRIARLLSLATALAFCALPRRVFPRSFRTDHALGT